jgi:hypothetical protein
MYLGQTETSSILWKILGKIKIHVVIHHMIERLRMFFYDTTIHHVTNFLCGEIVVDLTFETKFFEFMPYTLFAKDLSQMVSAPHVVDFMHHRAYRYAHPLFL